MVASMTLRWSGSESEPHASTMVSQCTADCMAEQMAHLSDTGGVEVVEDMPRQPATTTTAVVKAETVQVQNNKEEDEEENKAEPAKVEKAVEEDNKEDAEENKVAAVEVPKFVQKATEEITKTDIVQMEKATEETAEITKDQVSEDLVVAVVDQVAEETSKTMKQAVEQAVDKRSHHDRDMLDLLFERLEGAVCSTLNPLFGSQCIKKISIAVIECSGNKEHVDSNAQDTTPQIVRQNKEDVVTTLQDLTPQITDSLPIVASIPENAAIGMDLQDDVVTLHESGTMTSSWAVYDSPTESDTVDEDDDSFDKMMDQSKQKMESHNRNELKTKKYESGADIRKSESSSSLKRGLRRLFRRYKEQVSGKPKTDVILNEDSGWVLSRGIRKSKTSPHERERAVPTNGLNPRRIRTASPGTPLGQRRQPESERRRKTETRGKFPQRSKHQLEANARSQTRRGRPNTPPTRMKVAEDGRTSPQESGMSRGRSRQRTTPAPEKRKGKASSSGKTGTVEIPKRKPTRASISATRKTTPKVKTLGDAKLGKERLEVNLVRAVDGSRMVAAPKSQKFLVRPVVQRARKSHSNQASLRCRE